MVTSVPSPIVARPAPRASAPFSMSSRGVLRMKRPASGADSGASWTPGAPLPEVPMETEPVRRTVRSPPSRRALIVRLSSVTVNDSG